ncbi:MAG TPA: CBO0543 family protein [Syntrophomonadaceae bacterium]|nr:CBO0543 family protein [Syntrophomonadaceae bacterium]
MDPYYIQQMEVAYSLIHQADQLMTTLWLKYVLFGWRWWIGVFLMLAPWILWFIFRKKDSSDRLLYAGLFTILISSWFDVLGILFGLWSYYYPVVPFSPAFVPWDFSLLPVITMAFLQYKPKINPYLKAVIYSVIGSFIAQPLFVWMGYYNSKHWEHYYSFPIFFVIYLIAYKFSVATRFEKL